MVVDELGISLVNSKWWGDQVGDIHLLKKGQAQKIGGYFLWKIWNRPLSHIQMWRVVDSPLDSMLHGQTVIKHHVNKRGVWKDIGDSSEGREFAQWVTSKGIIQLNQATPVTCNCWILRWQVTHHHHTPSCTHTYLVKNQACPKVASTWMLVVTPMWQFGDHVHQKNINFLDFALFHFFCLIQAFQAFLRPKCATWKFLESRVGLENILDFHILCDKYRVHFTAQV